MKESEFLVLRAMAESGKAGELLPFYD